MPEISVIIPCYNQEKYIAECLESVFAQTFKDYEIIVINDGSTDNSEEIIKKYMQKHPEIKLISQENKGLVAARNTAIAQSSGKYIYPLDADDIIKNKMLEKSYETISKKKGDIITTRVKLFGKENGEMYLNTPSKYHLVAHNCLVNAALFRKSDFEKSGGYDEKFSMGLEDYDLWLNMVFNHKLKIYRIPEILFLYRIKDISESRNKQQKEQKNIDLMKIIKQKYHPQMRFWLLFYNISRKLVRLFYRQKTKEQKIYYKILGITIYKKTLSD